MIATLTAVRHRDGCNEHALGAPCVDGVNVTEGKREVNGERQQRKP